MGGKGGQACVVEKRETSTGKVTVVGLALEY